MSLKRPAATGLAFCLFFLASYVTNKYVLSVLKFTYPTLFQGWQTLVGGFLLHISWKIGWVEICISSSALEFPFLYFYRFHSSCFASGVLGFFLTFHTMKLKNNTSTGQYAAWSFLAKVITAGLSPLFFEITVNVPIACCLLLGGFAEVLLVYIERIGT